MFIKLSPNSDNCYVIENAIYMIVKQLEMEQITQSITYKWPIDISQNIVKQTLTTLDYVTPCGVRD